jgi:Lrp/AsnC family leucine-responsive transcriptional regulator
VPTNHRQTTSTTEVVIDETNRRLLAELQHNARITLALALSAVIRMRPASGKLQKVSEIARATLEVTECIRITGEDCYLMKLHLRDVQHLEEVIDRFTPFGQTTTSIVQSSPVPQRPITLD